MSGGTSPPTLAPERAFRLLEYADRHYGNLPFAFPCPYDYTADSVLVPTGITREENAAIVQVWKAMAETARYRDAVWRIFLTPLYGEAVELSRRRGVAFLYVDEATSVCHLTDHLALYDELPVGTPCAEFSGGRLVSSRGRPDWGFLFFDPSGPV